MAGFDTHKEKYEMFKKDAGNEAISIPTRIEAYFNACFHMIEANVANMGIHINKHQLVRSILEKNSQIFGDQTEKVWRTFQEIENQIRPGQIYGSVIDGKKLQRTKELFRAIEKICGDSLK
ncbi:MAG: hypothetical protein FVQ80_12950 [Planctomycetes bacterium]|nr:hypothetical protein [Planctomycetota bacterium]